MDKNNLLVVAYYSYDFAGIKINFNDIENKKIIGIRISINTNKITKRNKHIYKKVIITDNHIRSLDGLQSCGALQYFCATCNSIRSLDGIQNCTSLQELNVYKNKLTSLDGLENCTALQKLYICENKLTSLDVLQNCTSLQYLHVSRNMLTSLDGLENCTGLTELNISYNNIRSLDGLQNCTALKFLNIAGNNIISLDSLQNCTELYTLDISYNTDITTLPNFLLEFRNLFDIPTDELELELDARQRRWLNRIQNRYYSSNIYNNTQNVHDSSIQETVRASMRRLLNQPHLPKLSSTSLDTLRNHIVLDPVLTPKSKDQLLSYLSSDEELLELSLTYGELLWAVWQTIHSPDLHHDNDNKTITNGFSDETHREIKQILNQELADSDCKCFTGRMTRLVNCLNGFSPLVEVKILDGVQIGNIVFIIKQRLEASEEGYSVEKHRELFREEMLDRGESVGVIEEWLEYIE